MNDRGFFLTWQAVRRQLTAMPSDLYLIRLIHQQTRRAFPGERLWSAQQLLHATTIRFLRARNSEGCDVFMQPFAGDQNAGYILVDLDHADPSVLPRMRANGHHPCVVAQTSPGHWQAWIHLSCSPLAPALATALGKSLALTYGGDLASTDWRHLGRLAGFTNRKPARRALNGYAPWVNLIHAQAGLAPQAETLLRGVPAPAQPPPPCLPPSLAPIADPTVSAERAADIDLADAGTIYQDCLRRWHILERFPQPDWSIVDLWVARHLLSQAVSAHCVRSILRLASPQFPRCHGNPEDYLRRTLSRAAFPSPSPAVCNPHFRTPATPLNSDSSNSTGGR
jgi:hypothetical protein